MQISDQVHEFLKTKISSKKLTNYLVDDIKESYNIVANKILENKLQLEVGWSNYTLVNIDVWDIEDALELHDKLRLLDIQELVGPINLKDMALIIIYEYTYSNMLGHTMYTAKMIHVLHHVNRTGEVKHSYIFRAD